MNEVNIKKSIAFLYANNKKVELIIKTQYNLHYHTTKEILRYKSNKIGTWSIWRNYKIPMGAIKEELNT